MVTRMSEIGNASKFSERSLEWTLSLEELGRRKSLQDVEKYVQNFRILSQKETKQKFNSRIGVNTSSLSMGSGASLHMMSKSDFTSDEHDTIRQSKDSSAHGTTMPRKKRQSMSAIWTCLLMFND